MSRSVFALTLTCTCIILFSSLIGTFKVAAATPSFFHPATKFYFSKYDMLNAQWDAIHIVNVGTETATIGILCMSSYWPHNAHQAAISDDFTLGGGQQTYRTYPGIACGGGGSGPLTVSSNQPILVTQRILGWTAMQEIYGIPGDMASTDILFTWYDSVNAVDDIHVFIPDDLMQPTEVDLYVAGDLKGHLGPSDLGPGMTPHESVISFANLIGGPLRIVSDLPIFASQRVTGFGDFAEILGLPAWYTFTETWFNWYDMQNAWDAIHMVNPSGTTTANVQVYVAGTLQTSLFIPPGAEEYRILPGLIGGPVRVVSDQPILVTQRIVGWDGWKEVFGLQASLGLYQISSYYYMTWYDMQGASWDAIHFINPASATNAQVKIYIGGVLKQTLTVGAGKATYVTYPSLMGGPVRIVSTVPVMSSQRILGWDSFEETLAVSVS